MRDREDDHRSGSSRGPAKVESVEEQISDLYSTLGRDGVRGLLSGALESLYKDRIKPVSSYVRGRLKERSCSPIIVKSFVELYIQHTDLFTVEKASSKEDEATILLVTAPSWFKGWIDIDSSDDTYDETMWGELTKFFDGGDSFAGGRYGMARELLQRELAFLAPLTLGEICHIVQLSIQKRKLIVYHRKMLKPVQSTPEQPASTTGVVSGGGALEEIMDVDQLCRLTFRMLARHPQGIRLDRMKQTLKNEFSCQLNEMRLQCSKLIELFRLEPLKSSFALENDGKAFIVRSGDSALFTERVKRLYAEAANPGAKQAAAEEQTGAEMDEKRGVEGYPEEGKACTESS